MYNKDGGKNEDNEWQKWETEKKTKIFG